MSFEQSTTARTPLPVEDVSKSTAKLQVTNESVSFTDGEAGTTQRIKLTYDKIMSQYGERIAKDGDSSISWTTGTVLTTEVPWRFKNNSGRDTEADRLATLSNGEYMVDYENGYILGKNAISTSSTTDTISYKVRAGVTTGGDASAANQTLQLAQETAAAASLATVEGWDQGGRAKVNLIAGQTGIAAGIGPADSATVRVVVATPSEWLHDNSVAYEASTVSKGSGGIIRSVEGYNSKATAQFIQIHDAASLPADTAVPEVVISVPGTSNFSIDFGTDGYSCQTGIVVCNSSTGPTKTIGSADCWFFIRYI